MNTPSSQRTRASTLHAPRPTLRTAAFILLIVAAVVSFWVRWRSSSRAVLREVPRANLSLREGHWFEAGQTNPFTGWIVEFYPMASRLSRAAISNGLFHGVSE